MNRWMRSRMPAVLGTVAALLAASQVGVAPASGAPALPSQEAATLLGGFGEVAPASPAAAAPRLRRAPGISDSRSAKEPFWGCPEEACGVIIDPPAASVEPTRGRTRALSRFALPDGTLLEGGGEDGGLDPQDLQSAYDIPTSGGEDQTIALVDANGYPDAESDLAIYRERYGLPPCTHANGCFRKVGPTGKEGGYGPGGTGWEVESALDMDMVSAACPHCHILLVETSDEKLPEAVDTAVRLGATAVSNSWGGPESECGAGHCESENGYFDHPGIPVYAAGGDRGFDDGAFESPEWPAANPYVVAVGGTVLHRAENARGWSEEAWPDGGSGCSVQAKPAWQADLPCAGRTATDVAAVGACESPLSVYATRESGWLNVCGTSASTPLVAAIEAHATPFARSLPGADAFYNDPSALNDVTGGANGSCSPPDEDAYLCQAGPGYDGPTGNGSPRGALDLTASPPPDAVTRPATGVAAGAATLHGSVAPNGGEATYSFQYGTTTEYGETVAGASLTGAGSQVDAVIGGLSAGTVYHYRVLATTSAGTTYGADEQFSTAAPEVAGVSPSLGRARGGEPVTITGANFSGASRVAFGGRSADSFTVVSDHEIQALAAAGVGGVDVTVTTPAGTSGTGEQDRYEYEPAGTDLSWGANQDALGDGGAAASDVPVEIGGFSEEVRSLSVAGFASLAVLQEGRVMGWGRNVFGVVGDGTTSPKAEPVGVCAVGVESCPEGPYLEEATEVSAGVYHSVALLRNGTVVAWGFNAFSELGGAGGDEEGLVAAPIPVCMTVETPCQPANYLREVVAVSAGAGYTLALQRSGTVLAWGWNGYLALGAGVSEGPEKCGTGTNSFCSRIPRPVKGLTGVKAIAAGWGHALALLQNGTVMAWGNGSFGQLGTGKSKGADVPVPVCAVAEKGCAKHPLAEVVAIAATTRDSYAVLPGGQVAAWGLNGSGELGEGGHKGPETCHFDRERYACSKSPRLVSGLSEVTAVAGGVDASSALVVTADGELKSWGNGSEGGLGNGTTTSSYLPGGVCLPYAVGPCPGGPHLTGTVTAMAVGSSDLVALAGG